MLLGWRGRAPVERSQAIHAGTAFQASPAGRQSRTGHRGPAPRGVHQQLNSHWLTTLLSGSFAWAGPTASSRTTATTSTGAERALVEAIIWVGCARACVGSAAWMVGRVNLRNGRHAL